MHNLPELRNLRLGCTSISEQYHSLQAGTCPNLVHLDLCDSSRRKHDKRDELESFVQLMGCLRTGLCSLVLPEDYNFTHIELHSIVQYHGHSLSCLSIPWGDLQHDFAEDVTMCLHSLPHLKKLVLIYSCLTEFTSPITNPSITHLVLNGSEDEIVDLNTALFCHFPTLNTLSLCNYWNFDINELVQVLVQRPLIHTVHMDDNHWIAKAGTLFPNVKFDEYAHYQTFHEDY